MNDRLISLPPLFCKLARHASVVRRGMQAQLHDQLAAPLRYSGPPGGLQVEQLADREEELELCVRWLLWRDV